MAKTSTLLSLVHSLTKAERRYFKLYAGLQSGAKEYLQLFHIVEKTKNATTLKQVFEQQRPGSAFEAALKHLYVVLTNNLVHLKMASDKNLSLMSGIYKADILFEKSLYDAGFETLEKIQQQAQIHEQDIVQLLALWRQLYYLSNLNFSGVTENDLIKKQMKMAEIMRIATNSHQHNALYQLLRYRLVHDGQVRTAEQKMKLNDLVVSEMTILSKAAADKVESKKTRLLFQAHYFIAINDYKSALKAFYELIDLLDANRQLWQNTPLEYIATIEGILDSLRTMRLYSSMPFFLRKLQDVPQQTLYLKAMVQRIIFIYEVAALIDLGQFGKAIQVRSDFEERLFMKLDLLEIDKQAEVNLYTALVYFGSNDVNGAHNYLSKILLQGKKYYNLPIYQTFRLLHLLVHYELKNYDVVAQQMRSIKRKLPGGTNNSHKLEEIIFHFFHLQSLQQAKKDRKLLAEKFKEKFDEITKDKYEIQVLKLFNFSAWVEAKIMNTPFENVLKNQRKDEAKV